jgi:flagellar export protein FliJ
VKQRFTFPFDRLARVRGIEEQEARAIWARAEREADVALTALQRAEDQLEQARAYLRESLSSGTVAAGRVLLFQDTLGGLAQRVTATRAEWRAKRSAADALVQRWRTKKQECESLGRLRERALSRHRADLSAADARGMDDVALQRMAATRMAARGPAGAAAADGSSRQGLPADTR